MARNSNERFGRRRRERKSTKKVLEAAKDGQPILGISSPSPSWLQRSTSSTPTHLSASPHHLGPGNNMTAPAHKRRGVRARKQDHEEEHEERATDIFTPQRFEIYSWPTWPRPQKLSDICGGLAAWKAQQDMVEAAAEFPDARDADDWDEMAESLDLYPREEQLLRCIASTFVNRAKRAYRDGQPWQQFAGEETKDADAGTTGRIATGGAPFPPRRDSVRDSVRDKETLDHDLRLFVYEKIKVRLVEEIWLQEYATVRVPRESRAREKDRVKREEPEEGNL